MTLIHVKDVSHHYTVGGLFTGRRTLPVLRHLDLTLQAGQSVGLLGTSGSGKSTLARLLMGLETPAQGRVEYAGRPVSSLRGEQARAFQRTVQLVFQDAPSAFNPQRSIGWSIAEPLRHLLGLDAAGCSAKVAQLLVQVGLMPGDADKRPGQLSGGQLQRAGIARALAPAPRLIVLDEALSNLDRVLQVQILDVLKGIRQAQGTGFVLITHDLALVQYFCQRVVVLADGQCVEDCTVVPTLRFTHPAAVALQAAAQSARQPAATRPEPVSVAAEQACNTV